MKASDWIALAAVLVTLVVTAGSLTFSFVTQNRQQRSADAHMAAQQLRENSIREASQLREDSIREASQLREDALMRIRREQEPHIEFGIECDIHETQLGEEFAEFLLHVHNRGLVRWEIRSIQLRVRGIERTAALRQWPGQEPRLEFPVAVIESEVIPTSLNYIFVEPGVHQVVNYISTIPKHLEFIVVNVEFSYDQHTPHVAERVFRIK